MVDFLRGGYPFNRIRQFSFIVEYVYLAFLSILIIKKYQPSGMDFTLYWPLIVNISIALIYSIALYYSGQEREPSKFELIVRILYLYVAAKLLIETQNPSVLVIIVLPTVIMALRYSLKYTLLTAFMTTFMIIINIKIYSEFEFDYLFILLSFIWILGLLVNTSMEMERQMREEKQKLQERDKLAAIGQLAAGIAHEVRNPLTTIKGFVQLLYKYKGMKQEALLEKYLQTIDQEIDRVNDLLKDFLQYAKPVKPKLTMNNINQTVKDLGNLIEAQCINHSIRLDMHLVPEMPNIFCDYDQIKQVVLNIVLNAVDAMQQSDIRRLEIRTDFDENHVYIRIEDSGTGMTGEQLKKIFNPFYTNKTNGSGLGLSVCHSIIKNHRGRINVVSQVNAGTRFEVILPRFS